MPSANEVHMALKYDEVMKVDVAEQNYQAIVKHIDEQLRQTALGPGLSVAATLINEGVGSLRVQFKGPISAHHQTRLDREYITAGWQVKGIHEDTHGLYAIEFMIKLR
jgi:hypothetical protein